MPLKPIEHSCLTEITPDGAISFVNDMIYQTLIIRYIVGLVEDGKFSLEELESGELINFFFDIDVAEVTFMRSVHWRSGFTKGIAWGIISSLTKPEAIQQLAERYSEGIRSREYWSDAIGGSPIYSLFVEGVNQVKDKRHIDTGFRKTLESLLEQSEITREEGGIVESMCEYLTERRIPGYKDLVLRGLQKLPESERLRAIIKATYAQEKRNQ